MKNKQGLIATPITDKNGKQTTVYVKPAVGPSSPFSIPAPAAISNYQSPQFNLIAELFQRIDAANANKFSAGKLSNKIRHGTESDINLLATTLTENPKFEEVIAASGERSTRWNDIVSLAFVYDPDLPAGSNAQIVRMKMLHALENAHKYIKGDLPDDGWNLNEENEAVQTKAKRFVAAWVLAQSGEGVASYELIMRMLNNNRTDHDETLRILRDDPNVTVQQIDFILSGGSRSVSGGAL